MAFIEMDFASGGGSASGDVLVELDSTRHAGNYALNETITLPQKGKYKLYTQYVRGNASSPYLNVYQDYNIVVQDGGTKTNTITEDVLTICEIETTKNNVEVKITRSAPASSSSLITCFTYAVVKVG